MTTQSLVSASGEKKRKHEESSRLQEYCEGRIEVDELLSDYGNSNQPSSQMYVLANWKEEFKHPTSSSKLLSFQLLESEADQTYLFDLVDALVLEHQPTFKRYTRVCTMHRDIGFFAEEGVSGYKYARQVSVACALPLPLKRFMLLINRICGANFNGILVNRYNGGDDYISPHRDNEDGLEPDVGVVAVSLGAVRTMNFKTTKEPFVTQDIKLVSGSALCMNGPQFQVDYTHGIRATKKNIGVTPFQSKEERHRALTRISLTFRKHALETK